MNANERVKKSPRGVTEDVQHWQGVFKLCPTQSNFYPSMSNCSVELMNILDVMGFCLEKGVMPPSIRYFIVPNKDMKKAVELLSVLREDM